MTPIDGQTLRGGLGAVMPNPLTSSPGVGHDSFLGPLLAENQTLTGGLGKDTLIGAAADGDIFKDTAAGLNGDTISGFAGSDVIDIANFAPGAGFILS